MIESGVPLSAKVELFQGVHDFNNDVFHLALYTGGAQLTLEGTTAYTSEGEVVAVDYPTGGVQLQGHITTDGDKAVIAFADVTVPGVGMSVRAGLIYNSSKSNRAVRIIDFGTEQGLISNPEIRMPTPTANAALIRM